MSILKIGISSRALFDLNESHKIFKEKGIEEYAKYQRHNENSPLEKGVAFALVEKLLRMNKPKDKIVEVILLSRNSSDTGLRIFNSIEKNKLDITRAVFSGGESPFPYVDGLPMPLFSNSLTRLASEYLDGGFVKCCDLVTFEISLFKPTFNDSKS